MSLINEDVLDEKPLTDSSSEGTDDQGAKTGLDETTASSAEKAQSQPGEKAQTMEGVIQDILDKSTAKASPAEEKVVEGGDKEVVAKEKVEGDEPANDSEQASADAEPEPGKPVPYDRFKAVVDQRNAVREAHEKVRPIIETQQKIADFCSQANITQEQFTQALEVQALLNTDPAAALKRLMPIVESLQGFVGNKLPEDLQKEVDSGDLPLGRAKEIAQLRAQTQYKEKYAAHVQKNAQQREAQAFQQTLVTAASSWESSKRAKDPDYVPKAKPTDPDGKWELTKYRFLSLLHDQGPDGQFRNPVRTPDQMVALMERAYIETNSIRFGPRPARAVPLTRNGSPQSRKTSSDEPKTMEEAIRRAAASRGVELAA